MHPSLLDESYHTLLPTPLALTAATLAHETTTHGEHTTADELVACIEALFGLLGRLWIAEYLAVGAPDAAVNRALHDRVIAPKGPVLGGVWIGLARQIRAAFVTHGLRPAAGGLLDVDFGTMGDTEHPIARLSAYRNSFAHGSFHAVVDDIRTHLSLLEGVLGRLPFLVEQPFLLDTGNGVVALRGTAESVARPAVELVPGHPTLLGPDGRTVDLAPMAVGRDASGALGLAWPGKKDAGARDIVKHVQFQIWFERYQRELSGHIEAAATCLGVSVTWPEAERGLTDALATRARGLVLLETAPGAPRAGVLAGWADASPDVTVRWSVATDGLFASGLVLTRSLLRASELACGRADGSIPCSDARAWREALAAAARTLDLKGVVLRVALDHLHLGDTPAQPGEPSVQEVWRALAGGPFLAVGGAVRLWSLRPLPWDARVSLGWPREASMAAPDGQSELTTFLEARGLGRRGGAPPLRNASPLAAAEPPSSLARDVLDILCRAEGAPLDLFAICDALEAAGGPDTVVFEPEVERTLWNLAPVLTLGRAERPIEDGKGVEQVRTFTLLETGVISAALETLL